MRGSVVRLGIRPLVIPTVLHLHVANAKIRHHGWARPKKVTRHRLSQILFEYEGFTSGRDNIAGERLSRCINLMSKGGDCAMIAADRRAALFFL